MRMTSMALTLAAGFALPAWLPEPACAAELPAVIHVEAPELDAADEAQWINSEPLTFEGLKGRVTVLHFWTFGCINCIHNFPHYKGWHEAFRKQPVTVIGVHTPESRGEADVAELKRQAKKNGLHYPIVVDNDGRIWRAWGNQYWPCTYLIDKQGVVRYRWEGELEWEKHHGEKILRGKIEELLAEKYEPQKAGSKTKASR